jgi:hypothetical protein
MTKIGVAVEAENTPSRTIIEGIKTSAYPGGEKRLALTSRAVRTRSGRVRGRGPVPSQGQPHRFRLENCTSGLKSVVARCRWRSLRMHCVGCWDKSCL